MSALEIHGYTGCPFAWRARLIAAAKGAEWDYVNLEAGPADPRSARNPERRSPLLVHGDVVLRESLVIAQYLEEVLPGRALLPADPVARARARIALADLEELHRLGRPGTQPTPEQSARVQTALARLEAMLTGGAPYLGGEEPSLVDLVSWPFLAWLEKQHGVKLGEERPLVAAYWARAQANPLYQRTATPWALAA